MSTGKSDSSSGSTYSASETSVVDGTCANSQDEKEDFNQEQTEFTKVRKIYENLLKLQAKTHDLERKLLVANEKAARLCSQRKKTKQHESILAEESAQRITTPQFFEDSKSRYRLRREEHETQLGKLREEQLRIQENIFGKGKKID